MSQERRELFAKYPGLRKTFETGREFHDGREEQLLSWLKSREDYEMMRGNPRIILDAIDEFAANNEFLINIGRHKADVLTELILEAKPRTCVEFGGYLGYSSIVIASVMCQYAPDAHVWSLELDRGFAAIASELIALAGLSNTISVVVGPAMESAVKLQRDSGLRMTDLLILDHVEDMYLGDFKTCLEIGFVGKGSLVIADNVVRPGAPEYRAYIRQLKSVETKGVRALITPGDFEDEFEVTTIL